MSEKLFDLNDFKDIRPAEELNQLEQMKCFLLEKKGEVKGDEWITFGFQDFLQFCKDHDEPSLCRNEKDFTWAVRFWFGVADILSEQGLITAKRKHWKHYE